MGDLSAEEKYKSLSDQQKLAIRTLVKDGSMNRADALKNVIAADAKLRGETPF